MAVRMPEGLTIWTLDEVAECLPYQPHIDNWQGLYAKLYGLLREAKNPTPQGGDGSNGTVEEPSGRWNKENDDKAPHWWGRLNDDEQTAITKAWEDEYGDH